jgi:hypothetical protein
MKAVYKISFHRVKASRAAGKTKIPDGCGRKCAIHVLSKEGRLKARRKTCHAEGRPPRGPQTFRLERRFGGLNKGFAQETQGG